MVRHERVCVDVDVVRRDGYASDVSAGGVCLLTAAPVRTRYLFVAFEGVPPVAGRAALVRVVRGEPVGFLAQLGWRPAAAVQRQPRFRASQRQLRLFAAACCRRSASSD